MIGCKRSVVFILSIFILMPGFSFSWEEVENVRVKDLWIEGLNSM